MARWIPLATAFLLSLMVGRIDAEKPIEKKVWLKVSPQICLRACVPHVRVRIQPPEHAIFAEVAMFDEGGLLVTSSKIQLWPDVSLYVLDKFQSLYEPPALRVTLRVWFDDATQTQLTELVQFPPL